MPLDNTHQIILGLSAAVFLVSAYLVYSTPSRKELYEYSDATARKLCTLQTNYIVDAPWIGGERKRKQAFNNCMKNFYGVMPSAYVTSTFSY